MATSHDTDFVCRLLLVLSFKVVWSLHKHERFDMQSCGGSFMLSPCANASVPHGAGVTEDVRITTAAERALVAVERIPHTAPWEVGR